jgi:phenylpropionate dioxygenase-like ring-hydroxylating dioxygenase large terminal subunit
MQPHGANLANGCVKNGRLACPLHAWEYDPDGHCAHLPASPQIPAFARQTCFPSEVRGGHLFFFNRLEARFPLPFFTGVTPEEMLPARPFEYTVETSWQMIAGNGFDVQHFRNAHDRTLVGEPVIEATHAFARRMTAVFRVTGTSFKDRLTRWFAGPQMTMTVEMWAGNLFIVTAQFRRTKTYGMVCLHPLSAERTRGRVIVWVPRRRGLLRWLATANAALRRIFIRSFLAADVGPLAGVRVTPGRLIEADKVLAEYLAWLQKVHR